MSLAHVPTCIGDANGEPMEPEWELIERAKRDPSAFGTLYQQQYRLVATHVYRRTGDTHVTEDIVADVFVIALRTLSRYRYRGVPLRFWLLRIATNAVNRWARRERRRAIATLEADDLADPAVSSTRGGVDKERVQRALLTLPPKYQAVLSLYHLEGLSVKETSAIIGCREGTIRSRLTRARNALREKLKRRR